MFYVLNIKAYEHLNILNIEDKKNNIVNLLNII